ncbi:MAG: methyltransferase domain-containing protein [Solirubrobacteraceae bacterium]
MTCACPLCRADATTLVLAAARDRNRARSDETWPYRRCQSCGTIFNAQPPASPAEYYAGGYHGFDAAGRPAWEGNETLERFDAHRVALLLEHVQPGVLIEIGAGAGGFAHAAGRAGFEVFAIERDAGCCEHLSRFATAIQSGDPVGSLAALPQARVVAMWHVLEHLANPTEVLAAAAAKLAPGGVLAIGVPNSESLQFRLLRSRWAHLDTPRHLCLIPPRTLIECLGELGCELLLETTSDPFGQDCNRFGWECALRRTPSEQPAPRAVARAGRAITFALRPFEQTRGSAVLMLFRRCP